ncbi:hypothetical protein C5167_031008 [Papaver somniferum]|nr:hypothetical protein C5167_031008 [Papaver somniferum]
MLFGPEFSIRCSFSDAVTCASYATAADHAIESWNRLAIK